MKTLINMHQINSGNLQIHFRIMRLIKLKIKNKNLNTIVILKKILLKNMHLRQE